MPDRPCPNCGSRRGKATFREPPFTIVKCASCGLVFLGNPPEEDRLYEDYHAGADPGASEYRSDSANASLRELHAINEQRMCRIEKFKLGGRLLDVGCGRGFFLKTARDHGFQVRGIDVSERAVAHARAAFDVRADTESLVDVAASTDSFDVITLWHVLEHFLDPYDALRTIHSCLKPDGICVLEVPNLRSLKFMLSKAKWEGGNHPLYHRTFFTTRTLRNALRQSGFSSVERLLLSYHVPGRGRLFEASKLGLNVVSMDAFLAFVAWK